MGEDNPDYLTLQLKLGRALKHSGHVITAKMVLKELIGAAGRFPEIRNEAEALLD
jgi:hypothetical protein